MGLVYLYLYLPFMSAVTHVVDVSDELSVLDQSVYASIVAASDEVAVEALLSGDSDRLLNGQYDRVKVSTWHQRRLVRTHVANLEPASRARVSSLMQQMLAAGAKAFHHHTVERQLEQHEGGKPDKQLGTLLALSDEKKDKLRAGRALTHAQERMFGNLRLEHERAQTLLHDHLEGRVRVRMDDPVTWLLDLTASGGLTEQQLDEIVRFAAAQSRARAKKVGGRKGQYRTLGRARSLLEKPILEKAAEQRLKLADEITRLAALRVACTSALEGLSSADLLDQIRVFKIVDKARAPGTHYLPILPTSLLPIHCTTCRLTSSSLTRRASSPASHYYPSCSPRSTARAPRTAHQRSCATWQACGASARSVPPRAIRRGPWTPSSARASAVLAASTPPPP